MYNGYKLSERSFNTYTGKASPQRFPAAPWQARSTGTATACSLLCCPATLWLILVVHAQLMPIAC